MWITCPSQINHPADVGRVTSRYRVVRMADGWQIPPGHPRRGRTLEIRVAGPSAHCDDADPGRRLRPARRLSRERGVVSADSDIAAIRYCAGATANGAKQYNVLDVLLDDASLSPTRRSNATSTQRRRSCGLCGRQPRSGCRHISKWRVDRDPLRSTPQRSPQCRRNSGRSAGLRPAQAACTRPHCSTPAGVVVRAGGHRTAQAVDKGHRVALDAGRLPLSGSTLMGEWPGFLRNWCRRRYGRGPRPGAVSAPVRSHSPSMAREMGLT